MRLRARKQLEDKRRDALTSALRQKDGLEIIVRTSAGAQESVAKELRSFGDVTHIYNTIPYISVACDTKDASLMKESLETLNVNKFSRSFSLASRNIRGMEISAKLSIEKPKKADNHIWNLERIGAYKAQTVADGSGVKIGVIDTGVDYTHNELEARFGNDKGYDFVEKNKDPMDKAGHGTHVSGVIAGKRYGVAPGATLYSLRVLDENGSGSEANAMAAVEWALEKELDIVNLSMGSPYASSAFEDLCYEAAAQGLIMVAAAGNSSYGPNYPAAFDEPVIAVTATDQKDQHPSFSNIYETNDISAPGVNIISSVPGGYAAMTGTSMASPHVAGSLGLVASISSRDNLEEIMKAEAEELGPSEKFGAGMIRVDKMVGDANSMLKMTNVRKKMIGVVKQLVW